MRRWFVISNIVVYAWFLFGTALSTVFGMKPGNNLSPLEVVLGLGRVEIGELFEKLLFGELRYFAIFLPVLMLPFVLKRLRKLETVSLLLGLGAFFAAAVYTAGSSDDAADIIAMLFMLPLLGVIVPLQILAGAADGETFNEGFVCVSAVGWWMIVWVVAAWVKLIRRIVPEDSPQHLDTVSP